MPLPSSLPYPAYPDVPRNCRRVQCGSVPKIVVHEDDRTLRNRAVRTRCTLRTVERCMLRAARCSVALRCAAARRSALHSVLRGPLRPSGRRAACTTSPSARSSAGCARGGSGRDHCLRGSIAYLRHSRMHTTIQHQVQFRGGLACLAVALSARSPKLQSVGSTCHRRRPLHAQSLAAQGGSLSILVHRML